MLPEPLMQWAALIGALIVAVFFVREVFRWNSPCAVLVRPKQRKMRMAEVILIEAVFTMMFFGPLVVGKHANPIVALLYWTVCVFIGLAVLLVAMFDLLSITMGYRRYNNQVYSEFEEDDQEKK